MKGRELLLGPNNVVLFSPVLAQLIGLHEAVLLNQINYWIEIYKKQEENCPETSRHFIDGCWWVYNTYEDWHEQLPYISAKTIQRSLENLEKKGLIVSAKHNKANYDRTKWYTIDYDALDKLYESNSDDQQEENKEDDSNRTNCPNQNETSCPVRHDKMSKPIPKNTTKTTSENTTTPLLVKNVVVSLPDLSDEAMAIEQKLIALGLKPKDIRTLWNHANNNTDRLNNAIASLNAYKKPIKSIMGFLIEVIRNDYPVVSRSSIANPAVHNFSERTDTDWDALELKLLKK